MKIFKTIYTNVRKIAAKITPKQNTIGDELFPTVETFVRGKQSTSGSTTLVPYKKRKCEFIPKQYKKALSVQEANQYAQDVLGIKSFVIDDLELANQVNLSMTRAFNKTKGKITLPECVKYTTNFSTGNSKYSADDSPMQMLSFCPKNSNNCSTNSLEINKKYFDEIDTKIQESLDKFERNGQLSKNSKNLNQIDLITSFHYEHTLNRYYRLYKQGKLTPKAKVDFQNLLKTAQEHEQYLLLNRDSLADYLSKKAGVNLENLSKEEFNEIATKHLLRLKRKNNTIISNNILQTQNAIGVDGFVYHELGHSWHSKTVNFDDYEKCFTPYEAIDDKITAIKVSQYAGENGAETIGELVKGLLSGDKYSDDIMTLGNRLSNGKLQFLV